MLALVETRLASATPLQDAIQRPARLGSLEIGRFVAATMVFLTHITATATKHAAMPGDDIFGGVTFPGAIAVQYFFVLSGFVMMTSHRADFGNFLAAPRFWWRRACRIYPMYWISLSIVCIYLWGFLDWPMGLQLFSLAPINGADFVPPAWSLRYEMAFYIMFGLCLLPYVGRPLLAAWVLAVTLTWFPPLQLPLIGQSVSMFLASLGSTQAAFFVAPFEFYFFAGLLGGWLFSAHPPGLRTSVALATAGIAALLLSWKGLDFGYSYGPATLAPITGIAIACILTGFSGLERCGALRCGRWARQLGVISYPIYILHTSLLLAFEVQFEQLRLNHTELYLLVAGLIIAVFAICAAIAFAVDQPLQRYLRRFDVPLKVQHRTR